MLVAYIAYYHSATPSCREADLMHESTHCSASFTTYLANSEAYQRWVNSHHLCLPLPFHKSRRAKAHQSRHAWKRKCKEFISKSWLFWCCQYKKRFVMSSEPLSSSMVIFFSVFMKPGPPWNFPNFSSVGKLLLCPQCGSHHNQENFKSRDLFLCAPLPVMAITRSGARGSQTVYQNSSLAHCQCSQIIWTSFLLYSWLWSSWTHFQFNSFGFCKQDKLINSQVNEFTCKNRK